VVLLHLADEIVGLLMFSLKKQNVYMTFYVNIIKLTVWNLKVGTAVFFNLLFAAK
jgi:hypothetical protein